MILRALFSVAVAQLCVTLVGVLVPSRIVPGAGMVGYGVFADFDVNWYFRWFLLEGFALPMLAVMIFRRGRRPPKASPRPPSPFPGPGLGARLFLTGCAFGVGTAGWRAPLPFRYQVLAVGAAFALLALRKNAWRLHGAVLCALPLAPGALSLATRAVTPSGPVPYPWFPPWLALAAAGALGRWAWPWVKAEAGREKRLFYALALPVLIYLLWAELPVVRRWLHPLHDGESLVTARMILEGRFPWRDFLFQHGLLQDPLQSLPGLWLFGDSVFASDAGVSLLWKPLFFVGQYFLLAYLLKDSPWILLGACLLPLIHPLFFDSYNLRFITLPGVFLLLGRCLEKGGRWSLALGAALALAFILAPEALPLAVVPLVVLAYERWHGLGHRRSALALGGAAGTLGLWLGFLALNGALWAYLDCYLQVADAHRYGTAIPIRWDLAPWFPRAVALPVVTYFLFLGYLGYRLHHGLFDAVDAVMTAWNGFCLVYFAKFLARADEHILAHVGLALPVLYWLLSKVPRPRALPVAALGLVLFLGRFAVPVTLERLPDRIARRVGTVPSIERWGYGPIPRNSERILAELKAFFPPGEKVFDLTVEPALFHYLLGLEPALRHHYPYSNPRTQAEIVASLEKEKPKWVIYLSSLHYARIDGVPAMVRYGDISAYLLKHYRVSRVFDHHVILARGAPEAPPPEAQDFEPCDWGYALDHLTREPGEGREIPFRTRETAEGFLTELKAGELGGVRAAQIEAIEIEIEGAAPDVFRLHDGQLRGEKAYIGFHTRGGNRRFTLPVASCLQWAGLKGDTLYLAHRRPQRISSIRFVGATRAYGGGRKTRARAAG